MMHNCFYCFPASRPFVTVQTFDFVGSGSANLGFTVLQEILERRDQVVFGDFRSNCLLELKSKLEERLKYASLLKQRF